MNSRNQTDQTTETQTDPQPASKRFTCRHLHATGRRCGSPALRGELFCYYHHSSHRPTPRPNGNRYPNEDKEPFLLNVVEDRASIQLALSQVLSRIAANDLDPKRAGMLLYGLQIAVCALPREPRPAPAPEKWDEDDELDDPNDPASPTHVPEELVLDPQHGALAPVAEFLPASAKARPLSIAEQILERIANRPIACPVCHPTPPPKPAPYPLPTIQAVADANLTLQAVAERPISRTTHKMPSFRAQPGISVFVPAVAKRSSEGAAWPGRTAPWACSSPR